MVSNKVGQKHNRMLNNIVTETEVANAIDYIIRVRTK